MHKYRGIVTHSALTSFPVGTWVMLEADGVEVSMPSGVSVIRGATSHAVMNTAIGEGIMLSPDFIYGLARSAAGVVQLVGHTLGAQEAEVLLVLDGSGHFDNRLRLAGGDLQVRGADAEKIKAALRSGVIDAQTEAALAELIWLHGNEERDPKRFDAAYDVYRKLGGWKKCQTLPS